MRTVKDLEWVVLIPTGTRLTPPQLKKQKERRQVSRSSGERPHVKGTARMDEQDLRGWRVTVRVGLVGTSLRG